MRFRPGPACSSRGTSANQPSFLSRTASCSESQPNGNSGICKRLHGLWTSFDRPSAGLLAR